MKKSEHGCHGSQLHEDIFNAIRGDALRAMWKRGYEGRISCAAHDKLMSIMTGQDEPENQPRRSRRGLKIPDVMFMNCQNPLLNPLPKDELQKLIVMVEIGRFQPHKWPEYPVIHISFDGDITITGKTRRLAGFINDLAACIKDAIVSLGEIPPERQPVYVRRARGPALEASSGQGQAAAINGCHSLIYRYNNIP